MLLGALATACLLAASAGPVPTTVHTALPLRTTQLTVRSTSYSPDAPSSADVSAEEREFIDRINADRTERGIYALSADPLLAQVAWEHSRDMATRHYFSHTAPGSSHQTPMDRYLAGLRAAGQGTPYYLLVGENIYYCSVSRGSQEVSYGHQALMNSPGHRANILDPRFDRVGVGIYRDAIGQIWVTELFLRGEE